MGQDCWTQDARLCTSIGERKHHHHPIRPRQLRRVLRIWWQNRGPPHLRDPIHRLCQWTGAPIHRKQCRARGTRNGLALSVWSLSLANSPDITIMRVRPSPSWCFQEPSLFNKGRHLSQLGKEHTERTQKRTKEDTVNNKLSNDLTCTCIFSFSFQHTHTHALFLPIFSLQSSSFICLFFLFHFSSFQLLAPSLKLQLIRNKLLCFLAFFLTMAPIIFDRNTWALEFSCSAE